MSGTVCECFLLNGSKTIDLLCLASLFLFFFGSMGMKIFTWPAFQVCSKMTENVLANNPMELFNQITYSDGGAADDCASCSGAPSVGGGPKDGGASPPPAGAPPAGAPPSPVGTAPPDPEARG